MNIHRKIPDSLRQLDDVDLETITTLINNNMDKTAAARQMGLCRQTLYQRINRIWQHTGLTINEIKDLVDIFLYTEENNKNKRRDTK